MENTKRKQEIIAAARELFAKKGYFPTSMDDIAKSVGINKASLYYFFEGKEQIFAAIVEEAILEAKDYFDRELGICKPDAKALGNMIDGTISICLKNGIVIRHVDVKVADLQPIIFEKILPLLNEIKQKLGKTLACYGVKRSDLAAEVLVNAIHAYVLQRKHGIKIAPQKEYSEYLASLFIN
ncbi:MAG: TetR/AcrR family transcriptional regulator [Candidatus Pacebacteria bacterium]|jgi:AcrR family transcriptional regulator|nr:TetR/AcrR family transcriptional regulator [Candidatus Paceibacterota bacterium]